MFLQLSVHGRGVACVVGGSCVAGVMHGGGGHAWQLGVHGTEYAWWGACVVVGRACM